MIAREQVTSMLISHLKNFIYMKSVKTASTSIELYFEKYCLSENENSIQLTPMRVSIEGIIGKRGPLNATDKLPGLWYNHMPAETIKKQIGEKIWDSYFKFCTVRNPFDKAVSYFFMHKHQERLPISSIEDERVEFEEWLSKGNYKSDFPIYSIDNKLCVDDFIRYETMYQDLHRICTKLGIPFLVHRIKYTHSSFRPAVFNSLTLYTNASKQIVSEICALELSTFGYSFPAAAFKIGSQYA